VRRRVAVRAGGAALRRFARMAPATAGGGVAALVAAALAIAPASAIGAVPPPVLPVRAAILIEQSTGEQLYGVDPDERVPIASTTKLMTALVTLDHVHHLGQMFTAPD